MINNNNSDNDKYRILPCLVGVIHITPPRQGNI